MKRGPHRRYSHTNRMVGLTLGTMILTLGSAPAASAPRPVVAKTARGISFGPGGIRFLNPSAESAGYVRLDNFANVGWVGVPSIGFNRYGDYWILAEFTPLFSSHDPRTSNFNIVYLHYSIYLRFVPPSPSTPTAGGFFQFGFYDTSGWHAVNTPSISQTGHLAFSVGDLLTIAVRHVNSSDAESSIWVTNQVTRASANATMADADDRQGNCQIQSIYLGSGSHGNEYGSDQERDTLYGTLHRVILGEGYLAPGAVEDWINDSVPPTTAVLFDLQQLDRDILVPIFEWTPAPAPTAPPRIDAVASDLLWPGAHQYLRSQDPSYPCTADALLQYTLDEDLTAEDQVGRYLGFAVAISRIEQLHTTQVRITLENQNHRPLRLELSPGFAFQCCGHDGTLPVVEIPLQTEGGTQWENFAYDLVSYLRLFYPRSSQARVLGISLRGCLDITDMRLSNSDPGHARSPTPPTCTSCVAGP